MYNEIKDIDGHKFCNLWGGFSCECTADSINTFLIFYLGKKEVLSLTGNEANDVIDFVLSEYWDNNGETPIEEGFSTWLMGHYNNVVPTFDKEKDVEVITSNNKPLTYGTLVRMYQSQENTISVQKAEIKQLKAEIERLKEEIKQLGV